MVLTDHTSLFFIDYGPISTCIRAESGTHENDIRYRARKQLDVIPTLIGPDVGLNKRAVHFGKITEWKVGGGL